MAFKTALLYTLLVLLIVWTGLELSKRLYPSQKQNIELNKAYQIHGVYK